MAITNKQTNKQTNILSQVMPSFNKMAEESYLNVVTRDYLRVFYFAADSVLFEEHSTPISSPLQQTIKDEMLAEAAAARQLQLQAAAAAAAAAELDTATTSASSSSSSSSEEESS
jgi:hypothetical protein